MIIYILHYLKYVPKCKHLLFVKRYFIALKKDILLLCLFTLAGLLAAFTL